MTRLLKYYLDLVTGDGTALIGYAARLRISGLELGYSALLACPPDAPPVEHTALGRSSLPAHSPNTLTWDAPALGFRGRWEVTGPPLRQALLQERHGAIHWNCLAPRATVTASCDGRPLTGAGYAECLRLTLPPWRLPFRELHWGRYASRDHSLVWIAWQGRSPRQWLWLDGRSAAGQRQRDGWSLAGDVALRFLDRRDLRSRPVLGTLPTALTRLLPTDAHRLVTMHEHKELSRAALMQHGRAIDEGWAIHEMVTW